MLRVLFKFALVLRRLDSVGRVGAKVDDATEDIDSVATEDISSVATEDEISARYYHQIAQNCAAHLFCVHKR